MNERRADPAPRIAGRHEIEAALAARGIVELTCEFCNRRYTFDPAEARALFGHAPAVLPANARQGP